MSKRILLIFFLPLILFSCKRQIYSLNPFERRRLNVDEINFKYFQAKSRIKFLNGDEDLNAQANIRIKNDSIIWLSLSPAIGIEIMRAIITRDSVFVINRLKKEFLVISLDSLSRRLNFTVNYSMLQAALLGNLVLPRNEDEKIMRDGNYILLHQNTGDISVDNFVNSKSMKIEKVSIMDDTTRNYMNIDYHNFQAIDSVLFAMDNSISLFYTDRNKTINTQIIFSYTKASFSEKKLRFPFNVPNRYETREN